MKKHLDMTEIRYIIHNELGYNLCDNIYLYDNKLYKLNFFEEDRYGVSSDNLHYFLRFLALDGSVTLQMSLSLNHTSFPTINTDPEDIVNILLYKIEASGLQLIEDEIVNSEAFRALYL